MKALLSETPGGPSTLVVRDTGIPEPGPRDVRIAVKAAGLNYPDLLVIEDRYQYRPERPFAPGSELAGVVDAVGADVTMFKPGDRVLAVPLVGALAEYAICPETKVTRIPDAMPFEEAAGFLLTFGTSWHALVDRAGLKAGETLLILGASGGVGIAAIAIGKAIGARVVVAVSSKAKLDVALAAGADAGIVYPTTDIDAKALSADFKRLCGPDGANVIYDPVGGPYSEPALRAIAWEGRYLVVGFPAGIAKLPMNLPLLKACSVIGVFWGAAVERSPLRHREATADLLDYYNSGRIRPHIEIVNGLENAAAALARIADRTVTGKLVVTIAPPVSA